MRNRLVLVLAFLIAFAGTAAAEPRSWAAVKGRVAASAIGVGGLDVGGIQQSAIFQTLWTEAMTKDRIDQDGLDAIKAGCGVDAMAAIKDLTVVVGPDDTSVVVVALRGVDQATFLRCAQAAATHQGKGTVTQKKKGKVVEYTVDGTDTFYAAWIAADVVAFANDGSDRKTLEKLTGGKGAKGALAGAIGKASRSAPVWFAFAEAKPKPLKDKVGVDANLAAAHGTLTLPGGKVDVKTTLILGSADEATQLAAMVTNMLPVLSQQVAKTVPGLAADISSVVATAAGSEVTVTGSVSDATIASIQQMASGLKGP
jgi:hypothetical protein